jgi:outer membrane protein assembly factor BamB
MFAVVRLSHAQVSVLTYHNDNFRSGANTNETTLMPANVNSNTFGRLFARNVDGWVYAQPLVVAGLNLRGRQRNVVFVATEHDSVYAFDADTGRRYWRAKLLPRHGFTVSTNDVQCEDLIPEIGITSTPVIDPASSTLYVLAKGQTNSVFFQHLHALDLVTGAEKFGGPVAINATAPGNGNGSVNGTLTFDPLRQHQRAALLLANGIVYIAWGSHCDRGDYHGWVMGYNATTLQQVAAFVATPDGAEGGVWETGCGLAADTNGNLFCATGNGTFDADTGGHDFGDSVLKLSAPGLAVQDSFTPFNQADLAATDSDLGSGGVLLLPDQPGAHPHLAIAAGKEGKLYVLDRDNLGQFNSGTDQVVQAMSDSTGEMFSTPAYFNGSIYCCGVNNPVKAFALTGGLLSTNPSSQSAGSIDFPGATPSISANSTTNGIVWVLQNDGYQTNGLAILHAYDANDLTHELYTAAGRRQSPGPAVKFTVPTVANGHVYVGAVRRLAVYGLR